MEIKMHVLLIVDSTYPPLSGFNIRMVELAKVLIRHKHKVTLAAIGDKGSKQIDGMDVLYTPQKKRKGIFEQAARLRYAYRIKKQLNPQRIDYVIGWNFFPNLAAYLIGKYYNIKQIVDMTDFGY
jgi:hypothetical protein